MSANFGLSDSGKLDGDFSVIERLADEIRTEEDVKLSKEEREAIIQDLYEGPRKCQCCINWMTECPHDIDLTELNKDDEEPEDGNPLIVRRRVIPGNAGSVVSIHSIEIRHAATRKVLIDVFDPYDGIVQNIKYLAFLAPFHQFFWRWERFEKAVTEETDDEIKKILTTLKWLVKRELAEAFAVSKELLSHGVITFRHLWTLFPPGELVYSDEDDEDRLFILQSTTANGEMSYNLVLTYVDWSGTDFGTATRGLSISKFLGTRTIGSLLAFPSKYLKNEKQMRERLTERGRKFAGLVGMHYKAYRETSGVDSNTDLRVMIDTTHRRRQPYLHAYFGMPGEEMFLQLTQLIVQAPVDSPPPTGHVPLDNHKEGEWGDWDDPASRRRRVRPPPPHPRGPMPIQPRMPAMPCPPPIPGTGIGPPRPPVRPVRPRPISRSSSISSCSSCMSPTERARERLSDLHLSLCVPYINGYDLKSKLWRSLDVDRITDIEWNTKPFETLVLPDGYKELILAFVESQVKEKDTFDDVINGKGGGLVALLAGDPGVGKTLTAESVAEKIQAPLFKMELSDYAEDSESSDNLSDTPVRGPVVNIRGREKVHGTFTTAFELAARWGAVLLIDECDMYLEKRGDNSSKRNRMVSRFLKELEYYPSLLFLTTNRERVLDPAVYSRIHLTINYPALDKPSRVKIWRTFLQKNGSRMSEAEYEALSKIEVNGRRIRNIVKTSGIMAKREDRAIVFDDVRKVMKITEGLEMDSPEEL